MTPPDVPLEELNTSFLQKNPGTAAAAFSHCRSLWVIKGQGIISDVEESMLQLARPEIQLSIAVSLFSVFGASISSTGIVACTAGVGLPPECGQFDSI